jgi:hypothetical protein
MSGYDDPTPPSEFKIGLGYSSSEDAIKRIFESGGGTDPVEPLLDLLINSELAATALGANGRKHPVGSDFWKKLPRSDAGAILEQQDSTKVNLSLGMIRLYSLPREWRPVFRTSELDEKLPRKAKMTDSAEEVVAPSVAAPKNKGGRPTQHEWSVIWVEMCAYIDREGPPDKYAELVKHIQNMLGATAPAQSALHAKAKLLIDRIRDDQGLPPIT